MTDAHQNARPIHSQGLLLGAIAAGILILAVYLTSNIIESETGGISAAVRTIGACLAIWALVRPRVGLYIITIEGFSLDYIKKLSVYYGTVSMQTVIEVLVVGMLAVLGTLLGVLLQSVALRRYKLTMVQWVMLGLGTVASLAVLLAGEKTIGFVKASQTAFDGCVYIAVALPMSVFLTDRVQVEKLLSLQFFLATTWAVWGIKQYYTGFTPMEWFYAETGLSAVATDHMLTAGDTRPFGFGTGVSNYAVLSAYVAYGAWHILQYSRRRLLYILCTATVFWGVVTSEQRTTLLMPFLVLVFFFALKNIRRSFVLYGVCAAFFLLGVYYAETILAHFDDINSLISVKGAWGESVFNINTYSARIYSWLNLKDPANYSFFGLDHDLATHDIFSKILGTYGVVGLTMTLTVLIWGAWFVQRTILRVEDPQDRKFAIFCLAVTVPSIAVGFVGDGNFTAPPVNLQIWTFFGAAICMVVNSRLAPLEPDKSLAALEDLFQSKNIKIPMAARAALAQPQA